MAQILLLEDAISSIIRDGQTVAFEGFTHLIPFAAGHEVIRQGRKDLTLVRMTPDLIYDQMIGMGCARKLIFSWGGNPGVGSLYRFRDAVENQWPNPLEIEEHAHAAMAAAFSAGASNLSFAVLRGYIGSDILKHTKTIKSIECPFTREKFTTVPALQPDVTIIHAQKADRKGNVLLRGIVGVQKEAALAAKRVIVTVEEIVEDLNRDLNDVVLPRWVVDAVCLAPGGAKPSYAHGYYDRDNAFYEAWNDISRDRNKFKAWMTQNVLQAKRKVEAV